MHFISKGTLVEYNDYRMYVISKLVKLLMLDDKEISGEERAQAHNVYGFGKSPRKSLVPAQKSRKSISAPKPTTTADSTTTTTNKVKKTTSLKSQKSSNESNENERKSSINLKDANEDSSVIETLPDIEAKANELVDVLPDLSEQNEETSDILPDVIVESNLSEDDIEHLNLLPSVNNEDKSGDEEEELQNLDDDDDNEEEQIESLPELPDLTTSSTPQTNDNVIRMMLPTPPPPEQ